MYTFLEDSIDVTNDINTDNDVEKKMSFFNQSTFTYTQVVSFDL